MGELAGDGDGTEDPDYDQRCRGPGEDRALSRDGVQPEWAARLCEADRGTSPGAGHRQAQDQHPSSAHARFVTSPVQMAGTSRRLRRSEWVSQSVLRPVVLLTQSSNSARPNKRVGLTSRRCSGAAAVGTGDGRGVGEVCEEPASCLVEAFDLLSIPRRGGCPEVEGAIGRRAVVGDVAGPAAGASRPRRGEPS